jgi:hypothetical protein
MATYPVVDPISRDGGFAHGPLPTFSASRFAPPSKRVTIARGFRQKKESWRNQSECHAATRPRGVSKGAASGSSGATAYFRYRCNIKAHSRSGSRSPVFANSIIGLATSVVTGPVRSTNPSLPRADGGGHDRLTNAAGSPVVRGTTSDSYQDIGQLGSRHKIAIGFAFGRHRCRHIPQIGFAIALLGSNPLMSDSLRRGMWSIS